MGADREPIAVVSSYAESNVDQADQMVTTPAVEVS